MEFVTATSKEEIENAIKMLKQMLEMLEIEKLSIESKRTQVEYTDMSSAVLNTTREITIKITTK